MGSNIYKESPAFPGDFLLVRLQLAMERAAEMDWGKTAQCRRFAETLRGCFGTTVVETKPV